MRIDGTRVIVTGAAGFVPSHVVEEFVTAGAHVTAVDNFSSGKIENLSRVESDIELLTMDVRDEKLHGLMKHQDIVVHMAANADVPKSVADPAFDYANNVEGSFNVLRACLSADVAKVLFASSAAVYGEPEYSPMDELHPTNPVSPYGAAKLAVEKLGFSYHHSLGLPFTALRIFNSYGARQRRYVMYDLLRKLYRDPNILQVLGTGDQVRDYSYVTDTARCFLLAARSDVSDGESYNVAGGRPISIKTLTDRLVEVCGVAGVSVTFTGESWPGDIRTLVANINKAQKVLEFCPKVDLLEGLARLDAWLRPLCLEPDR